jgi:hypothetical protein
LKHKKTLSRTCTLPPLENITALNEVNNMDMQKQSFYEVDLLDEQLLPDNGLLIRTWSSIVSL